MTLMDCAIRMFINAALEFDSERKITSFAIYNSGYFKDCPLIRFAFARDMIALFSGNQITSLIIEESADNEDVDDVTRDSNAQATALAELNVLVEDLITNN